MSKSDQGYTRTSTSYRSGGGGRGSTLETYLAKTPKADLTYMYLRTLERGLIDLLGLDANSDEAVSIKQGVRDSLKGKTKDDLYTAAREESSGMQAYFENERQNKRMEAAQVLMGALESTTRARERENLDDGDVLDDPATLIVEGTGGWGDEVLGNRQYRKHVNICIDDSGSTRMEQTGFCSRAMLRVSNELMEVLYTAAGRWPGVTWDAFTFNRITQQHTSRYGQERRLEIVRQALREVWVDDPLRRDAIETNLAPLIEAMAKNEVDRGLIGSPRLDIILTDGEFESQKDADLAAEAQRSRGPGVSTYVLNLCPDNPSEVVLPNAFQVIPLPCLVGQDRGMDLHRVDSDVLRTALMRIVVSEVQRQE